MVVITLLLTGGGKAVSDNAALIGALAALGGVFTTQIVNALEAQRAQQARNTEQAQRERELEVGAQRAQDDALQAYLDQMSFLLLDRDVPLHQSKEGDTIRTLARARTLTVLSRLDGARKGNLVQFLYESDLITKGQAVVALRGADLSGANVSEADLSEADLSGAFLRYAYLSWSNLFVAFLSGAKGLTDEQLSAASSLEGATMPDKQTLKSADNPDGPTFEEWLKSRGRREDTENK